MPKGQVSITRVVLIMLGEEQLQDPTGQQGQRAKLLSVGWGADHVGEEQLQDPRGQQGHRAKLLTPGWC
jgi:hypothetical protein